MIQSIPLNKLVPSPRNVRKSSDALADLQLRADIAARGLLQNLVVRNGKRGKFEVEAGGPRRCGSTRGSASMACLPVPPARLQGSGHTSGRRSAGRCRAGPACAWLAGATVRRS